MSNATIAILRWCPADDPSGGNRPPSRDNEAWLLPCEGEPRVYEGIVAVPEDGVVLIEWQSPRPLRLWLDGMLVVDEPLYWRSFQREIRGAFVVPCRKGEAVLRAFTGERPSFAPYAAANCPSRNRQKVLDAVQAARPDLIRICGTAHAGVAGMPPVHLRFDPVQHQEGGIVYQRVEVKRLSNPFEPPGTDVRSTAERPPAQIVLRSSAVPYETKYAQYASPTHPSAPAKQAPADLAIAHVPIADAVDPLPPARGEDTETRAEPLLEIVRTDALTLNHASAAPSEPGIRVPLPVFESLGRLAPEREYRRLLWPSAQALLAAAPEPVLPAEWAGLGELYADAWRMLLRLVREPAPDSGLPGGYISTGSNFPVNQFLWDTAFTAIAAKYGARSLPVQASLDVIYSTQFDGGYIHRELDVRDRQPVLYEPDFGPNPPILTLAEWNLALLTGDVLRLKRVYPALKAYHQWIVRNRRQANGTYWTTGLAGGLDNSPSYGSGYPCLTAQMAHDAELLGKIAGLIGRGEEAAQWTRECNQTREALNRHLWDPDARIYAASLDEGGHNPNKIVTAFWPLLAGAVPADRVHDLARHLTDPAAFWRPHPIPSVAADSPHYVPEGEYWRGSVWAPTNYAAIRGFQRAGMTALARRTALKHLNAVQGTYLATGSFWENYCSELRGDGRFAKGSASAPDYSWSALGPIALLLETVVGLEPDAIAGELRWAPPPGKAIGAKRYPLGSATIDVTLIDEADGWHVHVRTDKPFRLRLELPGSDTAYDCRPGHQRWPIAMPEAETAPE